MFKFYKKLKKVPIYYFKNLVINNNYTSFPLSMSSVSSFKDFHNQDLKLIQRNPKYKNRRLQRNIWERDEDYNPLIMRQYLKHVQSDWSYRKSNEFTLELISLFSSLRLNKKITQKLWDEIRIWSEQSPNDERWRELYVVNMLKDLNF